MNTASRLDFIRLKLGKKATSLARPAGIHRTEELGLPVRPKAKTQPATGGQWPRAPYASKAFLKEHVAEWVAQADKAPEVPLVAPERRRKGKHALTKIAEQLPAKLPKIYP